MFGMTTMPLAPTSSCPNVRSPNRLERPNPGNRRRGCPGTCGGSGRAANYGTSSLWLSVYSSLYRQVQSI
jgi:hypothetical protein